MAAGAELARWTGPELAEECGVAYASYRAAKTQSYRAYFAANADFKADDHLYKARDLRCALPGDWGGLDALLPVDERHRHHLSGNSSQVLALGLLGPAARLDPSIAWLWEALGPLPPPRSQRPTVAFEKRLPPELLGEQPRQTSVDFFVEDAGAVICAEAKWAEAGIGGCSCAESGGVPTQGLCSRRVLDRAPYWKIAYEVFGMPERIEGKPCPLSFTYQAVRNVAAALALAGPDQVAVFALMYDAANPYFAGCGTWPGWPAALRTTLDDVHPNLRFRALSWQELLPVLPADEAVRFWASEKHGLH